MQKYHTAALAASLLLSAAAVRAEGYTEEWRILGPAWSYHSNTDQAQLRPQSSQYDCRLGTYIPPGMTAADGEKAGIPSRVCAEDSATPPASESGGLGWDCSRNVPWTGSRVTLPSGTVVTPTTYVCRFTKTESVRQWHQNNPALGLEYTRRFDDHLVKGFFSLVRDSYGSSSLMLGGAYMWPLADVGGFTVDGGIVGGVWFRSVIDLASNELRRAAVPFVFPGLSITDSRTGLGLSVGLAPKVSFKLGGSRYSTPTTVMVQATWLVKKTERSETRLSLEPQPGGGVRASVAMNF